MSHLEKKIERFLNNEADANEAAEVFLYFEAHPEIAEKYISDDALLATVEKAQIPESVTDRIRERLRAHIKDRSAASGGRVLWSRYSAAAAVAAVLIVGTALWWPSFRAAHHNGLAMRFKHPVVTDSVITVENMDKGSRVEKLGDGSVVTLQEGARISFHRSFGVNNRDIELTGNAVFKVAKSISNPFSVTSKGITTTALGTEFCIEPDANGIRISLYEGKVKVQQRVAAAHTPVIMAPGQVLHVNNVDFAYHFEEHTGKNIRPATLLPRVDKSAVNEKDASPDLLVFRKAPLHDVFRRIEEEFHVKVVFESRNIAGKARFTGSFTKNETPENMIATLCTINGLTYSVNGNTITITKQ